jgi:hypothetical protein
MLGPPPLDPKSRAYATHASLYSHSNQNEVAGTQQAGGADNFVTYEMNNANYDESPTTNVDEDSVCLCYDKLYSYGH